MLNRRGHNRPPFRPKIPGTDLRSPDVPTAIIYRPSRNAMQSGSRPRHWILEFEPATSPQIEPLMGWSAMDDPYRPIRLSFPDPESAIDYAERNDWDYIVRDDGQRGPCTAPEPMFRPLDRLDGPQLRGRVPDRKTSAMKDAADPVDLALLESFPASDPPAWTGTIVTKR
ncbi:ETC complex I subunit [Salipiger aestuarii]|uniref:ETC complex I subunit-like protein n=1 Tax=Salipiger aestuarii TaxID=568098 RepID=A0A327XKC6_9RHOB|nr:NADH dehydrogenase ubiquinone Fe-S protein 4 [Salipiger aestuarii]KAB2535274.1 ETC complex I subunit [Salipiger aestuarii]RAK08884.1 ETC complex I subunit-like protein [Salipiger aestuarii]